MSVYKLHYFNARGRAEPTRLCFVAAGVDYEDNRHTGEEWKKLKQEGFSPMGYLPLLDVDGKKLCESMAITRYVARELGLCPCDSFDAAVCDEICDAFQDVMNKIVALIFEKDEDKKKTMKDKFDKEQLPAFLTNMTCLLKSNNDGKGFFVGDKLSYADLVIFNSYSIELIKSGLEKFPELKAHCARIGEIPRIKEWIKNRPETAM